MDTLTDPHQYRVVGIDPGTHTLGVCVLGVCVLSGAITPLYAHTWDASRYVYRYPIMEAVHGDRAARLYTHEVNLLQLFHTWQPHAVASEGPYLGRLARTYAALTECVASIRRAVHTYDPYMPLVVYDPASVKVAVGVSGRSGDKTAMTQAIRQQVWGPHALDWTTLDEHAIDALAVGRAYLHYHHGHGGAV